MQPPPIKEGFLHKRGDKGIRKNWKKRWFVLEKNEMVYYENDNCIKLLGSIKLEQATNIDVNMPQSKVPSEHAQEFQIHIPGRIFFLMCQSNSERDQWLKDIKVSKEYYAKAGTDGGKEEERNLLEKELQRKEQELTKMRESVRDTSQLQASMMELQRQQEETQRKLSEKEDLHKMVEEKDKRLTSTLEEIATVRKSLEENQRTSEKLEKVCDDYKSQIDSLNKELSESQARAKKLESLLETSQSKASELDVALKEMKQKAETTAANLVLADAMNADLSARVDTLESQESMHELLKTQYEDIKSSNAALQQRLHAMELNATRSESSSLSTNEKCALLQENLDLARKEIEEFKRAKELADSELSKISLHASVQQNELSSQLNELRIQMRNQMEMKLNLEREISSLQTKLKQQEESIASLSQQNSHLAAEKAALSEKIQNKDNDVSQKENAVLDKDKKIAELEKEVMSLTASLAKSETGLSIITKERDGQKEEIESMRKILEEQISQSKQDENAVIGLLKEEIANLKQTVALVRDREKEVEESRLKAQSEVQLKGESEEIQKLKERIQQLEEENKEIQEDAQEELDENEKEIESLKEAITNLTAKVETLEQEKASLAENLEEESVDRSAAQTRALSLQKLLDAKEEQVKSLEKQFGDLTNNAADSKNANGHKDVELPDGTNDDSKTNMWRERLEKLFKERENEYQLLAQKEREEAATIQELQIRLQSATVQATEAQQELQARIKSESQRKKTSDNPQSIQAIDREMQRLKAAVNAHQTQNALLNREIKKMESEAKIQLTCKESLLKKWVQEASKNRELYEQLLTAALHEQGDKLAEIYKNDMESMKLELFRSTIVGIKLNEAQCGRFLNVDVDCLYETAKNIDWRTWNKWLHDTLKL